MKKLLITLCIALITTVGFSQKKGEINSAQIKEMRLVPINFWNHKLRLTEVMESGGMFDYGVEVVMKDGSVRKTDKIGGDLKLSQFKIKIVGGEFTRVYGVKSGRIKLSGSHNELNQDGRLGIVVTISYKKDANVKSSVFMSCIPPEGAPILADMRYQGDGITNVKAYIVPHTENGISYVKVTIECKFYQHKNAMWLIDPSREALLIFAKGSNGGYYGATTEKLIGSDGISGGDGGAITAYFDPACLKYLNNAIKLDARGGKGGPGQKGVIDYGRRGRNGKSGTVTIINSETNQVVSTSSGSSGSSSSSTSSSTSSTRTVARVESKTPTKPDNGAWEKKDNTTGKVVEEGMYKNGKRTGLWKFYYKEGQIKQEANYQAGKYHGKLTDYSSNGVVKSEGEFDQAKRVGTHTTYRDNGNKTYEWNYKAGGVKHGENRTWHSNGQLEMIKTYQDGKITGPYKRFYDDGSKQIEATYVNKKYNGLYTKYHKGENQKRKEGSYKLGEEEGVWKEWSKKGKLISEGKYEDGDKEGYWKFYSSSTGKVSREGSYLSGKQDGTWKKYNSRGELTDTQEWEEGKKVLD